MDVECPGRRADSPPRTAGLRRRRNGPRRERRECPGTGPRPRRLGAREAAGDESERDPVMRVTACASPCRGCRDRRRLRCPASRPGHRWVPGGRGPGWPRRVRARCGRRRGVSSTVCRTRRTRRTADRRRRSPGPCLRGCGLLRGWLRRVRRPVWFRARRAGPGACWAAGLRERAGGHHPAGQPGQVGGGRQPGGDRQAGRGRQTGDRGRAGGSVSASSGGTSARATAPSPSVTFSTTSTTGRTTRVSTGRTTPRPRLGHGTQPKSGPAASGSRTAGESSPPRSPSGP